LEAIVWLLERLQLREDQQLAITAGCEVFKRLLDRVLGARQALLKQQAAQAGMRLPNGRSADLETEEQMVKQLQMLERKEQFLVLCAALFVACVLDVCAGRGAAGEGDGADVALHPALPPAGACHDEAQGCCCYHLLLAGPKGLCL
jgi:hypothetical protein